MKNHTYFLAAFLWILLIIVSCNKEQAGTLQQADITALRGWLHESGGSYKNETIMVQATGKPVYGKLDWSASQQYRWQGNTYIDIPFVFEQGNRYLTAQQAPPTTFNLVVRKTANNQFEGAIRTTTYTRGEAENLTKGRIEAGLVVQSYQWLNGQDANLWMGQEGEGQPLAGKRLQLSATEIAALRAEAKNRGSDSTAGTLSRSVLLQQVCDVMVYTSYRTVCWYPTASDEAAMNVTCMSVPVLFSGEYCYNTPSGGGGFPPDPNIQGGGGGGGSLPEPPTPWDCDCNCSEDATEMVDANLAFEPKWGQLGTKDDIFREMINAMTFYKDNYGNMLLQQLYCQATWFHANRFFTRNANGTIIDANNSVVRDRYVYTFERGWIDMHHFFYSAFLCEQWGTEISNVMTTAGEFTQKYTDNNSSYSYEDIASNKAGRDFYNLYKLMLKNGSKILSTAVYEFLGDLKSVSPEQAPNFNYIPHILDERVPKSNNIMGLKGEALMSAAIDAF